MPLSTLFRGVLPRLAVLAGLSLAAAPARAQTAPTWASVQRLASAGPGNSSRGYQMALAADGSQYLTGLFAGTITLGPGVTLTAAAGTNAHAFLAKYDAAGVALWAVKLESPTANSISTKVAVDAAGNAYLAGYFIDALTLGTTTLTTTITRGDAVDGYLAKYNAQGVLQWTKQAVAGRAGNTGAAFLEGVATDASGNVTVAGDFLNTVSFGGTPFTGAGVFLYRFSPTGTLLLSKQVSDDGFTGGLALDAGGSAYITGGYFDGTTFGTTVLPSAGDADIFLCKLDVAGNVLWTQHAGGTDYDAGNAVAVDAAGNTVVGGSYDAFAATTQFGRIYVAGFTPTGAPAWTSQLSPTTAGYFAANAVAFDGRGGCYVTGEVEGPLTFGSTTLSSPGHHAFVARYNSQGTAVWAGGPINDASTDFTAGYGLTTDAAGNAYLVGTASGSQHFGTIASTGGPGAFVAKLTAGSVLTATRPSTPALALEAYPNPASGSTTLVLPAGGGRLAVRDALGRTVRTQALPATAGPCPVSLVGLAPGLYQLHATLANGQTAHAALQVR